MNIDSTAVLILGKLLFFDSEQTLLLTLLTKIEGSQGTLTRFLYDY